MERTAQCRIELGESEGKGKGEDLANTYQYKKKIWKIVSRAVLAGTVGMRMS